MTETQTGTAQVTNEPNFRLNIKQTSKGARYFDATVRGNTLQEVKDRYEELETFAVSKGCIKAPIEEKGDE